MRRSEKRKKHSVVKMTFWIEELANEAADPVVAGKKMREVFYCLGKLVNRQLTVDCLRKLIERKVGTHEVEKSARLTIKNDRRRNLEVVDFLLKIKLKDALKWTERLQKQFLREKEKLYTSINRGGLLKVAFWSKVKSEMDLRWKDGKNKIQEKVNRLETTYKGARTYTGKVGNIRVGDEELGEEVEVLEEPFKVGVEVNNAEAQILRKDPRFRDWCKISMEDIETDITVGLDNLRREVRKVEENGGKTLSLEEETVEKQFTTVVNHEDKTADFGKMRSTDMKQNKYFGMSCAVNRKDELVIQRLKSRLMEGARDVLKKTNDDKGYPRDTCYTTEERAGINSLKERRRDEGLVVCATDKSQRSGVLSEDEWMASMDVHTNQDPVVTMVEVEEKEKQLNGYSFQLARALRMGVAHGQEAKIRDNLRSEQVAIPDLYALIKDHKTMVAGEPVKSRPVCGALESPNGQLSNILSEVINTLTIVEDKLGTECRSSEEMRAAIKEANQKGGESNMPLLASEGGAEVRVIGSTDFKSYYQRLPVKRAAKIVARMAEESELDLKTDDIELGLFLASTLRREEVEAMGLKEVVQERLHNAGAAPGITSREIMARGPLCGTKWKPPSRAPTEHERRRMLGKMLELAINFCMENHFYMLGGEVKKQASGAGTGLRCSEALGRAFGLDWDRKMIQKLEKLDWPALMIKRYVDDLNTLLRALKPGVRYNAMEDKLETIEEFVEIDNGKEKDALTMEVFKDIANTVDEDIEVEADFPTSHADKFMPILDMKMAMDDDNKVMHKFYKKPMANKYTMMANSAVSDRVKRSSMTNEAMRRLLCCSGNLNQSTRDEIMEDFARMLKRSGYSERFRHEVISDAVRGYQKKLQKEAEGGRPVDRPREYQEVERRMARTEKRERYYRKENRSSKVREGVIITPPTPNSILANEMKKICVEELRGSNISLSVQERGGRRLAQELGVTVPGGSQKLNCQRFNCFPCNTGNEGVCRKTGAGYQIDCNVCGEESITNKYAGETGKNLFNRGANHVNDVEKKRTNTPLWKHILEKHNGVMAIPIFSHFQMKLIQFFSKPQRRKANEGVRISHLDPDIRMNSKDEFLQGCNIFMQPVRGVGM